MLARIIRVEADSDIGSRLFDHFVGEHEQIMRNREAKRICGLEVDDKFESGGLLDRDVTGLCPA